MPSVDWSVHLSFSLCVLYHISNMYLNSEAKCQITTISEPHENGNHASAKREQSLPSQRPDKIAERETENDKAASSNAGITPEFRQFVAKKLEAKLDR